MFENEVIKYIRQYYPDIKVDDAELLGKTVHICDRNVVFHLLPIPLAGMQDLSPAYFQEKTLEYISQEIHLVHLWQDCWTTKKAIVQSRISMLCRLCACIHARKTSVRRIARDLAFEFLETNHLQSFVDARYNYGLFYDDELVAVASFSAGRNIMRNGIRVRSFELVRYANLLHHSVTGGLGKLIARFIKDANPDDIMTYADLDWATGKSYQTLNFEQTGIGKPQQFWISPAEMIRYYPHRLPSKLMNKFHRQDKYDNIDDFLKDKGYIKIYNAGSMKYLLTLYGA